MKCDLLIPVQQKTEKDQIITTRCGVKATLLIRKLQPLNKGLIFAGPTALFCGSASLFPP
jgi:hypothetical protein